MHVILPRVNLHRFKHTRHEGIVDAQADLQAAGCFEKEDVMGIVVQPLSPALTMSNTISVCVSDASRKSFPALGRPPLGVVGLMVLSAFGRIAKRLRKQCFCLHV